MLLVLSFVLHETQTYLIFFNDNISLLSITPYNINLKIIIKNNKKRQKI